MSCSPGVACVVGCVRRESRVCSDSFRFTCFSIRTTCARLQRRALALARDLARKAAVAHASAPGSMRGLYAAFDRFIRVLRYVIFRGAEGSARKEARLEKQAVWLRESLIDLGPTFIKIGQALGTRADLLPLAYVKATGDATGPGAGVFDQRTRLRASNRNWVAVFMSLSGDRQRTDRRASLGQVYRARLATGEEVAVKVQRPISNRSSVSTSRSFSPREADQPFLSEGERERRLGRNAARVSHHHLRGDGLREGRT